MADIIQFVLTTAGRLEWRSLLDIGIVAAIIFLLLSLLRGTMAMALIRGILILYLMAFGLGTLFQLTMLQWLLRNSLPVLLIAVPVIFQPELRRALERLGRTHLASGSRLDDAARVVEAIGEAVQQLSEHRHGAIIVYERETGLRDIVDTGIALDALVTPDLIEAVFFPNSPLHDGAAIVRGTRVVAAGCLLPLSEQVRPYAQLGTRHRAALGITERTDAVSVVVSEETGTVSVAIDGRLVTGLNAEQLRRQLDSALGLPAPMPLRERLLGMNGDNKSGMKSN